MSAIEIRAIDHVGLRVGDIEASQRFHRDALGLYQLRASASRMNLVPVAGPLGRLGGAAERDGAGGTGPSMYVKDPDGNVAELSGPPA